LQTGAGNKVVWVVTTQSKIVGVMVMEGKEIFYLVISIEHRRKGIGRRLIKKAKALCGEGGVKAKVAPENTPVARLLAAEGFRFDWIIPGIPGSITESWIGYSWSPD
jgi:ribosomal protein S18 acetylase RimI-like enzyme